VALLASKFALHDWDVDAIVLDDSTQQLNNYSRRCCIGQFASLIYVHCNWCEWDLRYKSPIDDGIEWESGGWFWKGICTNHPIGL